MWGNVSNVNGGNVINVGLTIRQLDIIGKGFELGG
jgi:hypothetical protein